MNGKFYPFGQERPSATANDKEKFTGYFRDSLTNLDYADQRYHKPSEGRFATPDSAPSARVTDPGSWNKYPYAGGDPANNTDPTGQDWSNFFYVDNNIPQAPVDLGARAGFPTNYYVDGVYTDPSIALRFLNSGSAAVCPNNFCSGFITEGGGTTFSQFMPSVDGSQGYVGLTDTVVTPTPAEAAVRKITEAYNLGCQYATSACGEDDQVAVRYVGSTFNVQLNGNPLDANAAAADGYQDPEITNRIFHPGAPNSYYIGGGYIGLNSGHVVDEPGNLEAHYDTFAPFNPLHWILEALPSRFINTRADANPVIYTCSLSAGCHQ